MLDRCIVCRRFIWPWQGWGFRCLAKHIVYWHPRCMEEVDREAAISAARQVLEGGAR